MGSIAGRTTTILGDAIEYPLIELETSNVPILDGVLVGVFLAIFAVVVGSDVVDD
jgi:hypothetical protein